MAAIGFFVLIVLGIVVIIFGCGKSNRTLDGGWAFWSIIIGCLLIYVALTHSPFMYIG